MEVLKVVMLGMTGMLLGILLKGTRPEYSVYLSLAAGICIFSYMTGKLSYLFSSVLKIQEYLPVDAQYLETLLKMIGITYVSEFAAGICKDAGYGAIASQIDIFARLYIMVLSMSAHKMPFIRFLQKWDCHTVITCDSPIIIISYVLFTCS